MIVKKEKIMETKSNASEFARDIEEGKGANPVEFEALLEKYEAVRVSGFTLAFPDGSRAVWHRKLSRWQVVEITTT